MNTESKTIKNPSPLVLAVLTLDEHFNELKRLSSRVDENELKSNSDFEQCEKLINLFAEAGQNISADIANFVNVLNAAREEAEMAAQKVAVKADQLKSRRDDTREKLAKFEELSQKVTSLNESIVQFRPAPDKELSDEERAELKKRLGDIRGQLKAFIEEAELLKNVGYESKIKSLEQNADSMRQSLIAVSKKIDNLVTA